MIKQKYLDEPIGFTKLGWLSVSPKYFRAKMDATERDTSKYFDIGSAVHCKLLTPDLWKEEFYVMDSSIPEGKYAECAKELARLEIEQTDSQLSLTATEDNLKKAMAIAELKVKPEAAAEKMSTAPYAPYIQALKESVGKTVLSKEDMVVVSKCVNSVKTHKASLAYMNQDPFGEQVHFHELLINWRYGEYEYPIESTVDKLIVDNENKKVFIVDLKTTSKNVHNFDKSAGFYGYYRQLAIYRLAVRQWMEQQGMNVSEFEIECLNAVVQTTGLSECAYYRISEEDLAMGLLEFREQLRVYDWHCQNDCWDYPMEYYESEGVIDLKLDVVNEEETL